MFLCVCVCVCTCDLSMIVGNIQMICFVIHADQIKLPPSLVKPLFKQRALKQRSSLEGPSSSVREPSMGEPSGFENLEEVKDDKYRRPTSKVSKLQFSDPLSLSAPLSFLVHVCNGLLLTYPFPHPLLNSQILSFPCMPSASFVVCMQVLYYMPSSLLHFPSPPSLPPSLSLFFPSFLPSFLISSEYYTHSPPPPLFVGCPPPLVGPLHLPAGHAATNAGYYWSNCSLRTHDYIYKHTHTHIHTQHMYIHCISHILFGGVI